MKKVIKKRFFIYCGLIILTVLGTAAVVKGFLTDKGTGRIPTGEIQRINDSLTESQRTEEYIEYTYQIPESGSSSMMLSLESYWVSFQVFLDREEIYAAEDKYMELGVRRHWIMLPEEAEGRTLTIRFYLFQGLAEQSVRAPIYLGEKYAVVRDFVCGEGYALVFFCFALTLGAIIFVWGCILNRRGNGGQSYGFGCLGMFILDAGIWVLTDSAILRLFTEKTGVVALISFLSFLLLPCFMLLFLKEIVTHEKKVLEILCWLSLAIEGLFMFVYLFRILPVYKLLGLAHILIVITLFVSVRVVWIEAKRYRNTETQGTLRGVLSGVVSLVVFVVMALCSFWYDPAGGYAIFYSIGVFLFTVCLTCVYLNVMYDQMKKNARNAVYKQMAYTDAMTGLGNRAAFELEWKEEKFYTELACVVFDCNNLKEINDTRGHQEGDRLIIGAAECLREAFGDIGSCFRIGGDEFAVILKNESEQEVRKRLDELADIIRKKNGERQVSIDMACGYAMSYGRNVNAAVLFGEADKRMYEKKRKMKAEKV